MRVTFGLALRRGMGLGYLALFATRNRFRHCSRFGSPSGLYPFRSGATNRILRCSQCVGALGGAVVLFCGASCALGLTGNLLSFCRSKLRLSLSCKLLLMKLFGCTMPHLRTVLPTRCREIAVLCPMQVRPRKQDRYIFGRLRQGLIGIVNQVRIHSEIQSSQSLSLASQ